MAFPEVATVMGKAGRAETATDPAPLSMFETVVALRPRSEWRRGMTRRKLEEEIDRALAFPGMQNALTMPIRARVDMLTTGIRTPVGLKVFGDDLARIEQVAAQIEERLRSLPGTRSVYAERESLGVYLDFVPDRAALARYGLRVTDVTDVLETAVGGMVVDQTVEGRERFTVNVRYPRDLRVSREGLERILVPVRGELARPERGGRGMRAAAGPPPDAMGTGTGMGMGAAAQETPGAAAGVQPRGRAQVPLAQLGRLLVRPGPPMIKNEDAVLVSYVYVDTDEGDLGGYVERARAALEGLVLPPGYRLQWTGQYEFLERVRGRLALLVPLTLLLVAGILYLQFGRLGQVVLVMGTVPFSLVGSFWLLYLLGFNTSVAVWVGLIALVGIGAETSTIMVAYLDQAHDRWHAQGRLRTAADLLACAQEAALLRLRPVLMTVTTNLVGLVPIMLATGPGADVAKRIASPMFGGVITLSILTLVVVPAAWVTWRRRSIAPAPPVAGT
jgi:copper/silver efflux system protein